MASPSAWRRGWWAAALLGAGLALALPADNLQIESRVTEVRALPAQALDLDTAATGGNRHGAHHTGQQHGGGGGGHHGHVGYLRTQDSKGDHGYQKFDSFHKKNGDAYGFETHSAFGKADAKKYGDHEGAGTEHEGHYAGFGGGGDGGHFAGHYTGGEGGDGDGGHHFEEHYSSGGDGDGSHAGYSSGGNEGFHDFH
ncbi:hypothetical protein R5R35_014771 [Gryllus longicercus]|uniref:Accessory gland protein n=1 Tax=Gryllus longicercus TaxID=2509291 RepID=A0AAN9Z9X0_9ORTH